MTVNGIALFFALIATFMGLALLMLERKERKAWTAKAQEEVAKQAAEGEDGQVHLVHRHVHVRPAASIDVFQIFRRLDAGFHSVLAVFEHPAQTVVRFLCCVLCSDSGVPLGFPAFPWDRRRRRRSSARLS